MSKLRIFKFRKFKSDFPRGKRVENFLMEKPSPPLRNLVIFSKKMMKKTMISAAKTLEKFKNIESPKMVLKELSSFSQEKLAIILKQMSPLGSRVGLTNYN